MIAALVLIAQPAAGVTAPEVRLVPGERYTAAVPLDALFHGDRRWVPGEARSAVLSVRNDGDTSASAVWVALEDAGDPDALLADEDVRLDVRVDTGEWRRLPTDGARAVVPDADIAAGAAATVTLRATFEATAGNSTQRSTLDLPLLVGMSGQQDGAVQAPDGLPATGPMLGPAAILIGLVVTLIGTTVRRASRRRVA